MVAVMLKEPNLNLITLLLGLYILYSIVITGCWLLIQLKTGHRELIKEQITFSFLLLKLKCTVIIGRLHTKRRQVTKCVRFAH